MNYTIFLNCERHEVSFNYIETVGDLQSIILEKFKLKRENVLCILHDQKILGVDYAFNSNLIAQNLFNISLFIVLDPENQSSGSKNQYLTWLSSVHRPDQLIGAHRQIMYNNILNGTWSNTSVNFMSGSRSSSAQPSNFTFSSLSSATSSQEPRPRPRPRSRSRSSNTHSSGTDNNTRHTNNIPFTRQRSTRSASGTDSTRSTNNIPRTSGFGPYGPRLSSFSTNSSSSTPTSASTASTATASTATATSSSSSAQLNQHVQDLFSAFMGLPLSSSTTTTNTNTNTNTNSGSSMLEALLSLGDTGEITISSTTFPAGSNFWDMLNNLESVPVTLSQDLIDSLPTFKYSEIPEDIKNEDQDNCTICMQNYIDSDEVRVLLCKHYYHKSCIDRWLSQENTRCPVCRHDNRNQPQSQQSNSDDMD